MIERNIPIALQTHLKQPVTSTCRLNKITAVGAAPFGLCTLDRDVVYDDGSGDGPITYKAHRGYTPYANQADADLGVDNSEMEVLIATFDLDGITREAIGRGVYDDAEFVEYLVNYKDLTNSHTILSSGWIGRIRDVDGMVCFPELRSLTQTLKQRSMIRKGSVGCTVVEFGDAECKYDVDTEWVDADVGIVGAESDRSFSITGVDVDPDDDYYAPGVFEFYDGNNAGRTYEIETYIEGVVTLAHPTEEPIQDTDTGRIRRDCTRAWAGHNSCQTYGNRPNFRGQPMRPVADTGALMVPGASASG